MKIEPKFDFKMKPLNEKLILKDATINKVQFDTEWFYKLEDMAFYLKKIRSRLYLFTFHNRWVQEFVKCSSFEDIYRGRIEYKW
jgi:hypothetical protein